MHPDSLYRKYCEDENIIFHALMHGFANLWVLSKEKRDIEGDVIVEGLRSDYYVAFAPNHSWDDAIQIIRKKIEEFNPKNEILYRYFKYNMRKTVAPVMDEHPHI